MRKKRREENPASVKVKVGEKKRAKEKKHKIKSKYLSNKLLTAQPQK